MVLPFCCFPSLLVCIYGWIRGTDDCEGPSQRRVQAKRANSQTKLRANEKPFRLSFLFSTHLLLPWTCSLPCHCTVLLHLVVISVLFFSPTTLSPHGYHPLADKELCGIIICPLFTDLNRFQCLMTTWHISLFLMIYSGLIKCFGEFRFCWRYMIPTKECPFRNPKAISGTFSYPLTIPLQLSSAIC